VAGGIGREGSPAVSPGRLADDASGTDGSRNRRRNVTGDRISTMKAFLEAFNRHDVDAIMGFFVDDCEFDTPRGPSPYGRRLRGKEAVREGIEARFSGIPDVTYGDDSHWVSGDRGVSQWTLRGTTGDGQRIEVRGCDLFEFEGDKLRSKDSYWKIVE
jgi:ketosteroid isomerase-like protein